MLILTDGDRTLFRSKAAVMLERMKTFSKGEKIDLTDGYQVSLVAQYFEEVCSMGYSIALNAVHSTPWEYISEPILTDAARNDANMNQMSARGWELQFVSSGWMFWRRRKAVGDAEKTDSTS